MHFKTNTVFWVKVLANIFVITRILPLISMTIIWLEHIICRRGILLRFNSAFFPRWIHKRKIWSHFKIKYCVSNRSRKFINNTNNCISAETIHTSSSPNVWSVHPPPAPPHTRYWFLSLLLLLLLRVLYCKWLMALKKKKNESRPVAQSLDHLANNLCQQISARIQSNCDWLWVNMGGMQGFNLIQEFAHSTKQHDVMFSYLVVGSGITLTGIVSEQEVVVLVVKQAHGSTHHPPYN